MRILGVDYGDRKIGIAISDLLGITAQGLELYKYDGDIGVAVEYIRKLSEKNNVKTIVVGYPYNMNGTKGERARMTDIFIEKLENVIPFAKILKLDERLTTTVAKNTMRELNVKNRKKKKIEDIIAATVLLQNYLLSI